MRSQNTKNKQKAFTVIELLVVITIIGFLASAMTYALTLTRTKSRDTARQQAVAEIRKGLDLYFQANGSYPATGGVANVSLSTIFGQLVPTHMSTIYNDPKCPSGDLSCNYLYIANSASAPSAYSLYVPFERLAACKFYSADGSSLIFGSLSPQPPLCNY